MKLKFLLTSIAFVIINLSNAQVKYSNEFLSIGVGARSFAMGGAVVGSVSDLTANYWNPAGLSHVSTGLQLGAMHTSLFSGVGNYDYIAFAKPLTKNQSTIAVGVIRLGIDGIPNTLNLIVDGEIDYENISEFSESSYGIYFSYARALKNPNWRVGGSTKIVRRVIGSFANSIGFGIDLGLQYEKNKFFFGLLAKDVSTTFNSWKGTFTEQEIAILQATNNDVLVKDVEITRPSFIFAFGLKSPKENKHGLCAELDLECTTDGKRNTIISADPISLNPHFGLEYRYRQAIFIRGGLNNLQKVKNETNDDATSWQIQPNFGVGIGIKSIRIDYALSNFGNVTDTRLSHVFSLTIDLKEKAPK